MFTLKSRTGFPPGGFQYFQPETKWYAPFPMVDDFEATVRRIIQHRLANPRFNLPTDYDTVAAQLEKFTCTRLRNHPSFCEDKKKVATAPPPQPAPQQSKSFGQRFLAALAGVKRSAKGALALKDWLGSGGWPVSKRIAQERANGCIQCPLNDKGKWEYTDEVAAKIQEHQAAKTGLDLYVDNEDQLGTCAACGCNMSLKVHVPNNVIIDHTDEETLSKLDPKCWVRKLNKHPLLVVVPFCQKDYNQAVMLLEWIRDLGGSKEYPCLLVADCKIADSDVQRLAKIASQGFAKVDTTKTPYSLPNENWPIGPNWMFETALRYIYLNYENAFFWMEPDCIPLKSNWIKQLENEYRVCGKPFMGAVVSSTGQANLPGDHLTGCAIYPNNAHELLKHIYGNPKAFDMVMADVVVPITHHTKLYHHFWGQMNLAPVFRRDNSPDMPKNTLLLKKIPSYAVVHHRNKDGSLIKLLRTVK